MKTCTSIKEAFLFIDLVGSKIEILHNNSTIIRTYVGSTLSLIILIFFLYSVIYFGGDLIYREKPISRFSKEFGVDKIYLKDYPVKISVSNLYGQPVNYSDYLQFNGMIYNIDDKGGVKLTIPVFERCKAEFVKDSKNWDLINIGGEEYSQLSLCINPYKSYGMDGSVINEDVYIQNQMGNAYSAFIGILVGTCSNSTSGNKCLPLEEQNLRITNTYVTFTYLDSYINLNNYTTPASYFQNGHTASISPTIPKSHKLAVKKTEIETDSGIIMEDTDKKVIYQIESKQLDIQSSAYYYTMTLAGHNLIDSHFRRYIKVQDIIASLGGLIKFLITFASIFMKLYTYKILELDVINRYYNVREVTSTPVLIEQRPDSSISQSRVNIKNNNFVTKKVHVKNLRASVFDYASSLCRCRSKYSKSLYYQFEDIFTEKMEVMNLYKDSINLENLVNVVLSAEQKEQFKNKRTIIPNMGNHTELNIVNNFGLLPEIDIIKDATMCNRNNVI
jgi:hypothetical protein